jgi:hypothetical protein
LAVAVTLAWPLASVTAVGEDSVADAPDAGTVNFTVTPLTGLPLESFTVASSACPKAVEIAVVCGEPPVNRMVGKAVLTKYQLLSVAGFGVLAPISRCVACSAGLSRIF